MRIFGFEVSRQKAAVAPMRASDIAGGGGWFPLIREPFAGAWQRNIDVRQDSVLNNPTVFRCVSLLQNDIAKMRMKLINETSPGVWEEADNPAWSPVIRKPNHFENRIQFFQNWMGSKLNAGNTYVLKERDGRNVVVGLYVLDPLRVRTLVSASGDIFYQLYSDDLAGVAEQTIVPASEVIHDRWSFHHHPLVGKSPMSANGLPATQAQNIQEHSTRFFANGANPGGILTAPGRINSETAERLKTDWQERFSGSNAGRVAVLGDGLKYEPMMVNALNSQLIEQLRWTDEKICSTYGVPAYKVGAAPAPTLNNIEALERQYYQACLQIHIESIELCVDEGLGLPANWGVEFDLDGLIRMDTATLINAMAEGRKAGIITPNESRKRMGLGPQEGGDVLYMQEQEYGLPALAKRDQLPDPFGNSKAAAAKAPSAPAVSDQSGGDNAGDNAGDQQQAFRDLILRAAARHDRLAA